MLKALTCQDKFAVKRNARSGADMFSQKIRLKLGVLISVLVALNLIWLLLDHDGFYTDFKYGGYSIASKDSRRNWHDYESIKLALARTGLGEVGSAVQFDEYKKALYKEYGFDAALSDQISLNRSVPDVRPGDCMNINYLAQLPKATMIIIFYNERLSVLLRTVYSILNRTPKELIHEIILVDDGSSWAEMQAPLSDYLMEHFPPERSRVRLLRLSKRSGLMVARMAGARTAAKDSEVFVFLDAHFEVNYNWLPPLLEPIALNPKACTVPALDRISFETFGYKKTEPVRGYFDWKLNYQMRPLSGEELAKPAANFREYVMMGGAMAISVEFFWHLGGFDEGMIYWGGEQYEMSFKIWMCDGELINVPCSRIGHVFRDPFTNGNINLYGNYDFAEINFRRLVDVWLDEKHRQYVYNHRPSMKNANPGDLTERFALKERLQCKNFSWMLDNIMPDLKEIFPPVEPDDYGRGIIRSKIHQNSCITINRESKVILADCNDKTNFQEWQRYWRFTWRCELRIYGSVCLESDITNRRVTTYGCHQVGGNQKWHYDPKTQWIKQFPYNVCMVANIKAGRLELGQCSANNENMKWIMGFVNQSRITTTDTCVIAT